MLIYGDTTTKGIAEAINKPGRNGMHFVKKGEAGKEPPSE